MYKRILLLIFFSFSILTFLTSEPLFMPGREEVIELAELYTRAGRTLPAHSFPVSRNRLIKWAEELNTGELSELIKNRLDHLLEKLSVGNDSIVGELDWMVGYEHYFKTKDTELDISHDYLSELPLAVIGGSFVNYDYGGACLELFLKREYSLYPDSNFFISKPGNPVALENQIVTKGYVFFENDFIQLIVGRLPIHYGDPRFSSFMANQKLPYLDQIKLDMTIGNFKLEYFTASLENREAEDDYDLSSLANTPGTEVNFGRNSIITMMHRLVYSFDSVKISIAEQAFISRSDNQFYIGDFIPLTVWHNAWLSTINISFFTDISWTIIPGLEGYFQWAFDDINASEVFGINDSTTPTIDSFILGLFYTGDIDELPINLKLEIGHTHYLWGGYNEDYPLEAAVYRIFLDHGNKLMPFSSPYGPGAFWLEFDTRIKTGFGLSGGLFFNYLNKNTLAGLITTPYERADALMAIAPRNNRIEIGIEVNYNLFDRIDFYVVPTLLHQFEIGSTGEKGVALSWFECTLGGKVSGHEWF